MCWASHLTRAACHFVRQVLSHKHQVSQMLRPMPCSCNSTMLDCSSSSSNSRRSSNSCSSILDLLPLSRRIHTHTHHRSKWPVFSAPISCAWFWVFLQRASVVVLLGLQSAKTDVGITGLRDLSGHQLERYLPFPVNDCELSPLQLWQTESDQTGSAAVRLMLVTSGALVWEFNNYPLIN